jgi:hypothetical protein
LMVERSVPFEHCACGRLCRRGRKCCPTVNVSTSFPSVPPTTQDYHTVMTALTDISNQ